MADNPFEIPQALRDVSEQNLKQAHAEYEQLMDLVTKTMCAWTGAIPPNPMAAVFKDVQGCALHIARENAESIFTFACKISNALTPQDIVTLQTLFEFAQDQMQALVTQTQQLFNVIEEAVQKSERGAMGASMGAMPSNPMVTSFKDVQDRAVENREEECRVSFRAGREDRQGTEFTRYFDTSDPFLAQEQDAGASQTDRGKCPEAPTRLMFHQYEGVYPLCAEVCTGQSCQREGVP